VPGGPRCGAAATRAISLAPIIPSSPSKTSCRPQGGGARLHVGLFLQSHRHRHHREAGAQLPDTLGPTEPQLEDRGRRPWSRPGGRRACRSARCPTPSSSKPSHGGLTGRDRALSRQDRRPAEQSRHAGRRGLSVCAPLSSRIPSDRRVIEVSWFAWFFFLNGLILTTRPARKRKDYAAIWNRELDKVRCRPITRAQASYRRSSVDQNHVGTSSQPKPQCPSLWPGSSWGT
jgi:hypothetical protein